MAGDNLANEINKLKVQEGKPVLALEGASFAPNDLVDSCLLMVHSIALGKGKPVFSELPAPRLLKLVSSKTLPLAPIAQTYQPA